MSLADMEENRCTGMTGPDPVMIPTLPIRIALAAVACCALTGAAYAGPPDADVFQGATWFDTEQIVKSRFPHATTGRVSQCKDFSAATESAGMACTELRSQGYQVAGLTFTIIFNFSSVDHRLMQIELAGSEPAPAAWLLRLTEVRRRLCGRGP